MDVEVSVVIPTRGNVDMQPVIDSLPPSWEILLWNNGRHCCHILNPVIAGESRREDLVETQKVNYMGYGRHAAARFARGEILYTQDDDVIVSSPEQIVEYWRWKNERANSPWPGIVANIPRDFRRVYRDSAMLGFGSAYHRTTPQKVLSRFLEVAKMDELDPLFLRESDRALTALTPVSLVDVDKEDREFASDPERLWMQPDHIMKREAMLKIARRVRAAR